MKEKKTKKDTKENAQKDRLKQLIDSLELITSRMLETTMANNQLATSQTPEMRRLFDTWTNSIAQEMLRILERGEGFDIKKISNEIGLTPASVISLLLAMDRQGRIEITHVAAVKGDGKNREICDCMQ